MGSRGAKPEFVTHTVENTLLHRVVFNCGQEQLLLWGPNKAADVQEIHDRLKFVTAHVIDRVEAEFDDLEHFSMFDVIALREAYGCTDPATAKSRKVKVNQHVKKLAQDLRVDSVTAVLEYMDVAKLIFNQTSPGRPLATKSNNEVWSAMLRPDVALSNFPQRRTMQALHVIIRFYLSIEDGECANERDLGDIAKIMAEHKKGADALADDVVLAQTDPITTTDIRMGGPAVGGGVQAATLGSKGERGLACGGAPSGHASAAAKRTSAR